MRLAGLEPLSQETQSLLANERNFSEERAELRARVSTRARAVLVGGPIPTGRSFWQRRMPLLVAALLVLAFAAAAIAARRELHGATERRSSVPPPVGPTRPEPARAVEPGNPVPEATPEPPKNAEKPERARAVPASRQSLGASAEGADALELGLLQRARGALAKGEYSRALEAIAEHQRRFPAGRLREEREALRIKALAGLGRTDEARRAAERFRERFPRSVLSSRVEETARPNP